jgi:hypothetical protein
MCNQGGVLLGCLLLSAWVPDAGGQGHGAVAAHMCGQTVAALHHHLGQVVCSSSSRSSKGGAGTSRPFSCHRIRTAWPSCVAGSACAARVVRHAHKRRRWHRHLWPLPSI